jgi:hypothetical protein
MLNKIVITGFSERIKEVPSHISNEIGSIIYHLSMLGKNITVQVEGDFYEILDSIEGFSEIKFKFLGKEVVISNNVFNVLKEDSNSDKFFIINVSGLDVDMINNLGDALPEMLKLFVVLLPFSDGKIEIGRNFDFTDMDDNEVVIYVELDVSAGTETIDLEQILFTKLNLSDDNYMS